MEPTWELTLLLIGFGLFLGFLLARASFREARTTAPAETPEPAAVPAPPAAAKQEEPLSNRQLLLQAGRNLSEWYSELSHPSDLATSEPFNACVEMMVEDIPLEEVYGYLSGDLPVLSCAAATALARRKELVGKEASLVHRLQGISIYARFCLMAAIARDTNPQTAWSVLLLSDPSWRSAMGLDVLRTHLAERLDAAHAAAPEQQQRLAQCPEEQRAWLRQLLEGVDAPGTRKVLELLQGRGSEAADTNGIREFARVLQAADVADAPQPSPTQNQTLKELAAILAKEQGRSILLVGDAGVGKSTVTGITVSRLLAEGWTVFEASAAQVLAGQSFIGQIEQRIQDLLRAVGGRPRVLWIAHDLFEFAGAGRTMQSRTSILDLLLPSLLAGELRVLAPLTPASCENLLREAPQLRDAVTLVRLPECSVDETFALARAWIAKQAAAEPPICEDRLLLELNQRAQQYLAEEARPGNLLKLLGRLREHVLAEGAPRAATLEDVVALLSRMSGLPAAVLDDRDGLDLPALRSAFQSRVMGQPEAVDCLVERIAMLKAGLCDPKRPIGVFLFTGPTGTGKTELCRALAEYMFGGAQRMLRLDMSEYQHPESIGLLLGDSDAVHGRKALVHRIREQPFSVVLFDEIEKAHPMVFDLLLQVFDEGRLTDRRGRIANFRHAILIATSNLGVHAMEGAGLGFGSRGPDLHGALEEVFRREFLNRIDRIVMFRSLDQETMRQVLHKELDLVLQRRGLRERPWAVEWDESALQFLLAQGWSPTLGARPLRRAIERHVLAPLAAAIVGQSTPEGDQFLLVHSDGKTLQVEFIDPEEPAPGPAPTRPAVAPAAASLRLLAREGAGTPAEVAAIQRELAALQAQVAAPRWAERKAAAYAAMGEPDFWTSARRHEVLSRAETMSRIEEALTRASERAAGFAAAARPAPTEPLRRLAARVLLLQLALDALEQGVPQDAYVSVAPVHDPHGNPAATAAFARQLSAMYRAWAELRGMELRTLDDPQGTGASVFAVAGFAAFTLLGTEAGLHVLDADETRRRSVRVRVAVAAQPTSPVPEGEEAGLARDLLAASHSAKTTLVRRYRQHPTPEIRDRVRGWRTGKWARVFEGEFDAME